MDNRVKRLNNDINGNPRYYVDLITLGLSSPQSTKDTRRVGLTKYRGKEYGAGFWFSSYSCESDLDWIIKELNK